MASNGQFVYYPKKFIEFNYESSGPFYLKEIGNGLCWRPTYRLPIIGAGVFVFVMIH